MFHKSKDSASELSGGLDTWRDVRGQRAVMLTTYRRDGSGVATPVGYGIIGDRLFFMTKPATHKVGRLSRDPRCTVAASTLRGEVKGQARRGVARVLNEPEAEAAATVITAHNRIAWFFLLRRARRQGQPWTVYEVTAD